MLPPVLYNVRVFVFGTEVIVLAHVFVTQVLTLDTKLLVAMLTILFSLMN